MDFFEELWEDYSLPGIAFVLLGLFFIFRLYQTGFRYKRLRREGLVGQIIAQVVIAGILTCAAAILCWPEIVGLHREELGMAPRRIRDGGGGGSGGTSSKKKKEVSETLPSGVSWTGTLAPAKTAIEKKDYRALARVLAEAVKKEPARSRELDVLFKRYPVGPEIVALAREAFDQGDLARARDLLDLGIELAPSEPEGYYYRALARLKKQPPDVPGAFADLEVAVRKAKPGDVRAVEKRLELRLAARPPDVRGAVEDLDRLVAARPHDVQILTTRGRRRLELGELDPAIADLESASRAQPADVAIRFDLIEARLKLGRQGSAERVVKEVDEILRLAPQNARAYYYRGLARFHLKQADFAISDLSRALQLDPNMIDALFYRGRARLDLGKALYARADFDQVIKMKQDHRDAYYWRGLSQLELDPRHALEDLTRAIDLAPDPWAYFHKGDLLLRMSRRDASDQAFADALANATDVDVRRQIDDAIKRARARPPAPRPPR